MFLESGLSLLELEMRLERCQCRFLEQRLFLTLENQSH
ncbi:unnamed protein product [Oikopleura dioica]|uniref:Uncharacterized protein n=1 Tax=Oikopleura dioica TaxID=34765 RepID=E4XZG7_OIKDI|nr:unnamed protein product [Oikopleura dioica]CBY35933.1 unnamed protein product [Oikopleura dioica]